MIIQQFLSDVQNTFTLIDQYPISFAYNTYTCIERGEGFLGLESASLQCELIRRMDENHEIMNENYLYKQSMQYSKYQNPEN